MSDQRYPLQWPAGKPRTTNRHFGRFSTREYRGNSNYKSNADITLSQVIHRLQDEPYGLDGKIHTTTFSTKPCAFLWAFS